MTGGACLVTGGAGFIGCALSSGLMSRFERVIAIDKMHPQVHATPARPAALHPSVEFRHGDITQPVILNELLSEVRPTIVIHLAAETGTGQSLLEGSRHAHENVLGTTVLLDALARHQHVPERIVLSSSRAVYGEGDWRRADGSLFHPGQRSRDQLVAGQWDHAGATHVPFSAASTQPRPTSIYGATKLAQEHVLEAWALAFGSHLSILRLQNVYGPGQSLINSYTGIVSLFARLAREGRSIPLYEDGAMLRDFVYIDDIASAFMAALDAGAPGVVRLDVGLGEAATLRIVAEFMAARYGAPAPHVSGQFRHGDVRHASCSIEPTLAAIDWQPVWPLERGLESLCRWIDGELGTAARS